MTHRLVTVLALTLVFLTSPLALAAQDALVTVPTAQVREKPYPDAPVLETRNAGEKIRVSSFQREGWYKIKTRKGKYGWIFQADLAVNTEHSDVKAANVELKGKTHDQARSDLSHEPRFFFRLEGAGVGLSSADVSLALGAHRTKLYPGGGGFGELAYGVDEKLRVALRGGFWHATATAPNHYGVSFTDIPLMIGLDADVSRGPLWEVGAGLYGGVTLISMTVAASDFGGLNSFTMTGFGYTGMIDFSAKYWFSNRKAIIGDLGLFFASAPGATVPNHFNGEGPFLNSQGGLSSLRLTQIGPVLGLGVLLAF